MKRLHVHIAVSELLASIEFYSTMFGASPSVERKDYAKWDLEDPLVNFAISSRGHKSGLNHLGIQVETESELAEISQRLVTAEVETSEQRGASCCYAHSNKHWALDPQGIAWESFHTLEGIATFGADADADDESLACCIPLSNDEGEESDGNACCIPGENDAVACCS